MAKKAYIGVNGVARNIQKIYTGAYFGGSAGRTECIVSAAGSLLYTFSGRNYKKSYAGDAYCASVIVNGWLAPLLVSRTAANVAYSTDGNYTNGPYPYSTTVTFRGATWYVSSDGALFQTTANPSGNVIHLNAVTGVSSYSSLAEAALALLNYVNWLPAGNGIARKIRTGYIGVNGVARQFFNRQKLYLYNEGDECVNVTGGWDLVGHESGSTVVTKEKDSIKISYTRHPYYGMWGFMNSRNKIDFSNYSKIHIVATHIGVISGTDIIMTLDETYFYSDTSAEPRYEHVYDISSYKKTSALSIRSSTGADVSSSQVYIYQVWLE